MKIISVTNRKGGVGKSTMAATIGAGLAMAGLRVCIVDTDSQGHVSLMLAMPDENGLYNALINKQHLPQVVREVAPSAYLPDGYETTGALFLLPSSDLTYKIPLELQADETFLFLETMETLGEMYGLDAIIIDTNPSLSLFDGSIYMATDGYIYVTECERLSIDGIQTAIQHMTSLNKTRARFLNRRSEIVGIIPNKFRANTVLHRTNIEQIAAAYPGIVWPPVSLRTAWGEASNFQIPIFKYAAMVSGKESHQAVQDASAVVNRVKGWLNHEQA